MAPQLTALIFAAPGDAAPRPELYPVCGRPVVAWVIHAAHAAGADRIVVVTDDRELVAALPDRVEALDPATTIEAALAGSARAIAFDARNPLAAATEIEDATANAARPLTALQGPGPEPPDLLEITRQAQRRLLAHHAANGVAFTAPDSVAIDVGVTIGAGTTIHAGVTLRGATSVGAGCHIGPQTTITDSVLGDGITVPHSFLVECRVADSAKIGPFAYLRPEADIRRTAKVGTFVEVKKSTIHEGAKVPHLSYIGDADVGANANLGAGTITANYHRGRKTRTTIGEDVRTGVHTALVAPVNVGDAAYTGAGSVITKDVPEGALAVTRSKQNNIEGYAKRIDEESKS